MPAFLIPWLLRGVAVLAVVGALYGLWYSVDHWCNESCIEQSMRANKAEDLLKEAQDRASALALLWSESINRVEVRYREQVQEREQKFSSLRERAADAIRRHSSGSIVLRGDSADRMRDISDAANAHPPAAEVDHGPTKAVPAATVSPVTGEVIVTPEAFAQSWAEAAEAYADVYAKWQAAVQAYQSLQVQP